MTEVATGLPDSADKLHSANMLVSRFARYAAVGGLVPVPVVDMVAVAGVQLKMMEQLSHLYGVPFRENLGKELIGTIIGTGISYNFGSAALMTFTQYIRFVPVAGQVFGLAIMPAFAAATTAALGRIFVRHFESGGTLLDLNISAARKEFKADFARRKRAIEPGADASMAADAA